MLISNLVFEDSLEMRIQSADFDSRVNSAVQSFMEGVESMLAQEPVSYTHLTLPTNDVV